MNTGRHNYITVNNPTISLLPSSSHTPFGQFIDSPQDEENKIETSAVTLQSRDMYLPNFSLRVMEGQFSKDVLLVNQKGEGSHLLGSCLFLKGNMRSFLPRQRQYIECHNRSQNFKYDPHNEYLHALSSGQPFHYIHFAFASEYFMQFLPENERWADLLKTKIDKQERILGDRPLPITLTQELALQNIFNCPLTGKLGLLMLETSIVQIILLQLHSLFSKDNGAHHNVMPIRDFEAIHELKEYLAKTFLEDHSMSSLSKHFGMNTNKLMTMFKRNFGKCIFEYISELRMEHANQLLHENQFLVHEVARTVGYKNPNHFSAAFKKRYGINPSRLVRGKGITSPISL